MGDLSPAVEQGPHDCIPSVSNYGFLTLLTLLTLFSGSFLRRGYIGKNPEISVM